MKRAYKVFLGVLGMATVAMSGCDKNKPYDVTVAPAQAHFTTDAAYIPYYITNDPNSTYTLTIGATDVSNSDRTVSFTVSSPTGAVAGTHYIITGNTVTIPAGKATATLPVKGIFAPYAGGRKDTLVIALSSPSIEVAPFQGTVSLVLQRYCNVDLTALSLDYNNTMDYDDGAPSYGPYSVTVLDPTPGTNGNGKSKDTVTIDNFYDEGYSINVVLDWTDPANFKTTVIGGSRIGTHPTYGAMFISPRGNGTFSSCDQTFTINWTAYVADGAFPNQLQTRLRL